MIALDVIRGLAWPVIVASFLIYFRIDVANLMRSISERSLRLELPGGIKASADFAEQGNAKSAAELSIVRTSVLGSPNEAISMIAMRIRSEIPSLGQSVAETTLVSSLAQKTLDFGHEYHYNRIFGSQILFLRKLNEIAGATMDEVKTYFQPTASAYPQMYDTYKFDGWIGFLQRALLVKIDTDIVSITPYGVDFLLYMTRQKLAESKLF